ncbi:hypothetical protein GGU10DRAFT_366114 [Lentinula aff. detonsa]|uniref:Uncharacterized protein n=1 Tax=Lentinula aff. detonsa TaxID=2804958 RepID=A0AA38KX92_9AGAR|nr:hypothetical protein GGU10DRAFT_366114 [Lentinula aff. detonsa]
MFGLIRRISNSVFPRPDRPWDDDATSNAPKVGRKRRLSSTERDSDEDKDEQSRSKKHRGDTPQTPLELPEETAFDLKNTEHTSQVDSEGVKEVTQGVKAVELEVKKMVEHGDKAEVPVADINFKEGTALAPESVPLPEDVSGELDDSSSIASTPPADTVDEQTTDASEQFARSIEKLVVEKEQIEQSTELDADADNGTPSVPTTESLATKEWTDEESKDQASA